MEQSVNGLSFSLGQDKGGVCSMQVTVTQPIVMALYTRALSFYCRSVQAPGFARGAVSTAYVDLAYRPHVLGHVQELLLQYCIISYLCDELIRNRVIVVGDPQLASVHVQPNEDALFEFSFMPTTVIAQKQWIYAPFKAPTRRNYKDIDKQVICFAEEEDKKRTAMGENRGVQMLDWVCFTVGLLSDNSLEPLIPQTSNLWVRIGKEEIDQEARELFLGKLFGETFVTNSPFLQKYFSKQLDTDYQLQVTIKAIVPHAYFSFPLLKKHFNITTMTDMRRKLVEVFSMRNDISLRLETVGQVFKGLLRQCPFHIPDDIVRQQAKVLTKSLRQTPDYRVYRTRKDFSRKVFTLAEKQLKESIIIDYLAGKEDIHIDADDVSAYMNLMQRPRTREFIYFDLPPTQANGQEQPIPAGIVHQACLREKALNYVIRMLTKYNN
jgi:FKBP-type peptidyl-prolyl cis-trans isomerase (trigger factor)